MSVVIRIPTVLRRYTGEQSRVSVTGVTAHAALDELARRHPELREHLFDPAGKLRPFVNVFVGDTNLRDLEDPDRALAEGAELSIVPAVAGGAAGEETGVRSPADAPLTAEELARYNRHLILPEVGMAGQRRLKASSVLLVGTGGLGSPLAVYLAAAGVGRIGLVDFDVVDFSNLQRQIIHFTPDVGRPKLHSARDKILALNPNVTVELHETRLDSTNALRILADYDVIVDGTDNFPTRYLVNDACVLLGKPNVYGSIFRFEGQASVFDATRGPCYRCLYPEPPPPGMVPSCAEGGVLGILPGTVGAIQATETIKLLLGTGEPLIGRLLLFDALQMSFREVRMRKDPGCPICGENPTITELIDYEEFCGMTPPPPPASVPEISARDLSQTLDTVYLLDVREPHEADIAVIPGAHLLPLGELPGRWEELDQEHDIVVHCRSGVRSARAVRFLLDRGFPRVRNLRGGILAWSDEVDPTVTKY